MLNYPNHNLWTSALDPTLTPAYGAMNDVHSAVRLRDGSYTNLIGLIEGSDMK